ncbi:MAG: hypothetical protein B7Z37_27665 [Verrucomicrobia bacterium 12-59-8]|nr:MAG: hypothetical protein B7Z37_27665 [Verrucomicrobia bacterium 12-59-8]
MSTPEIIVLGAINHHEWPVVAPWIRSLRGTGFNGRVILVAYEDISADVITKMQQEGVDVRRAKMEISVNRGRFKDFETILRDVPQGAFVVTTDVRDVVFQTHPAAMVKLLDPAAGKALAVSSEGWSYRDSDWNLRTLKTVFPAHEASLINEEVYCSGVIIGTAAAMADLSARIWELSREAPSFNGDQVALNIILREPAFVARFRRLDVTEGSIFHARPTGLRRSLGDKSPEQPVFSMSQGEAFKANGERVHVLHQYTESKWERLRVLMRYNSLWIGIWYRLTQRFRSAENENVYWKTKPAT